MKKERCMDNLFLLFSFILCPFLTILPEWTTQGVKNNKSSLDIDSERSATKNAVVIIQMRQLNKQDCASSISSRPTTRAPKTRVIPHGWRQYIFHGCNFGTKRARQEWKKFISAVSIVVNNKTSSPIDASLGIRYNPKIKPKGSHKQTRWL